jgi:uncharacterized protein (DUF1800 family)
MSGRIAIVVVAVGLAGTCMAARPAATALPDDTHTIVHVLNRIAFAPRPGDIERVQRIGLDRYIEEQLHPERIPDAGVDARLAGFTTLNLSIEQIARDYERPQAELRKQLQQQGGNDADPSAPPPPKMVAANQRVNSVLVELSEQKLLRAIYSERQLQEVLTDFWFNHFNVDARKGRDRFMVTAYERDTIRPHVLGTFRDLLGATAKSPAMLFYLDNWMSVDPNGPRPGPPVARRVGRGQFILMPPPPPAGNKQRRGLNENYGRELMELHTLGVDGGYTQKDVTEVARAFTGWTIENPQQGGEFRFEPRLHDEGEKVVLGHRIRAGGGMNDGEEVLDILASQPATAHFIALELARHFVSDAPPPALVDRVAARFRETNGDLREVMRTILTSPEFLAPDASRAKIKTPFEFVVSAVRALGAEVDDARPLVNALQQLGMPLYQCQPPTGYKDTGDAWTNTGALVSRMNLALQLSSNRMKGISVVTPQVAQRGQQSGAAAVVSSILNDDASDTTRATIAKATTAPQMAALALGSPEFQKR